MLTHVLRSAAHAGAIVMYNELHAKVPVEKGVLKSSLFRWFNVKQSTPTEQRYLVGPNKQEAGHWANVEFGHWRYNKRGFNGNGNKTQVLFLTHGLVPSDLVSFRVLNSMQGLNVRLEV